MAGESREVEVKVNIVPGDTGGMEAAARRNAEVLRRAQDQIAREGEAAELRRAVTAQRIARGEVTIPQSAVQVRQTLAQQAREQAAGLASSAGGVIGALGQGNLAGAAGALGGPVAALGGAVAGIAAAITAVDEHFQRMRPTLAEVNSRYRQQLDTLNQARRGGGTSAEQFMSAATSPNATGIVSGATLPALLAAQNAGNYEEQQRLVRQVEAAATQRVGQLQGRNLERGRIEIEAELRGLRSSAEIGGSTDTARLQQLWGQYVGGPMPQEFSPGVGQNRREFWRGRTDEQITQAGQNVSAPLINALSLQRISREFLGPMGIPSLRAGAPEFPEGTFQSRSMNVLDSPRMIQAELFRDQREEQRFQALMRSLEDWREEQRRRGAPVVI
jgi:hypothetical protein